MDGGSREPTHHRSGERATLKRKLDAGVNIHMPAPRRIGKTWTIGRLAGDLRSAGWLAVEVDVQGMSTPHQFAADLCARIEEQIDAKKRVMAHLVKRLDGLLGGGWGDKPLEALGRVDPVQFAETLVDALSQSEKNTVIIIDEISYFFLALAETDAKAAHQFAYQLRALQLRYKKVRWLITGSIGLDTIARRYNLQGAFVDFETFPLESFTPEQARSYLRDPAVQEQLTHPFTASDEDFEAMFADLGWLAPFYLKLVANEVRPSLQGANGPGQATKADFDAAFDRLLQPHRRAEFAVWPEHVRKNLPAADRAVAEHVLAALSRHPEGETEDTLIAHTVSAEPGAGQRQIREVLSILVTDGLLMRSGQRFKFRSGLVRRYWLDYEAA